MSPDVAETQAGVAGSRCGELNKLGIPGFCNASIALSVEADLCNRPRYRSRRRSSDGKVLFSRK